MSAIKNLLPPFAMERLGSTHSYGNKFGIGVTLFIILGGIAHSRKLQYLHICSLHAGNQLLHLSAIFFTQKNGTNWQQSNSKDSRETGEAAGGLSFLFSLHFLATKRCGLYVQNMNHSCHRFPIDGKKRVTRP